MDVRKQGDSHVNYFLSQDLAFLGAGQGVPKVAADDMVPKAVK